jgi:hypothetical protein
VRSIDEDECIKQCAATAADINKPGDWATLQDHDQDEGSCEAFAEIASDLKQGPHFSCLPPRISTCDRPLRFPP